MEQQPRVWTEEHFRFAFEDLGAKAPKKGMTNPDLHRDLVSLLKERDPKASDKDVESRLDNIFDNVTSKFMGDEKKKGNGKGKAKAKEEPKKDDQPTPKHPDSCDSYGAGFQKNAKECKACPDKTSPENVARCSELSSLAAKAKKKGKADKGPSKNVRAKYGNFEELKSHLSEAPADSITMVVNKMLPNGWKWTTILKKVDEARDDLRSKGKKAEDFKDVSRLKSHVAYMEKAKGWVFKKEGEKVQLVDYKPLDKEAPATEKKAA